MSESKRQRLDDARELVKVAVLGAGAYGTALAHVVASNGHIVSWYMRNQVQANSINAERRNPSRLSTFKLHANITATCDFEACVEGAAIILHAIPAQQTPDFIKKHAAQLPAGESLVYRTHRRARSTILAPGLQAFLT